MRSSRKTATDLTIRYRPRAAPSILAVPLIGKPAMSTVALSGAFWFPVSRQPPSAKVRSNASRPEKRTFWIDPPGVGSVARSRQRPTGQLARLVVAGFAVGSAALGFGGRRRGG